MFHINKISKPNIKFFYIQSVDKLYILNNSQNLDKSDIWTESQIVDKIEICTDSQSVDKP